MAKRPDTPCAGKCGTLLWGGTSSLPPGKRMCRPCRAARPKPKPPRKPRAQCAHAGCVRRPRGNSRCYYHRPDYAERMRAHYREQTHRRRRRSVTQHTDITIAYERALRTRTKRCPLCQVRMVNQPYLPASKELDHIIPLNVGGTHTIGNVRIICRSCNAHRPTDGSDFTGQPTLWSQDLTFAARLRTKPQPPPLWSLKLTHVCGCGRVKRLADPHCAACRGRVGALSRG